VKAQTIENLDFYCADFARRIADALLTGPEKVPGDDVAHMITRLLSILHQNGLYAALLYMVWKRHNGTLRERRIMGVIEDMLVGEPGQATLLRLPEMAFKVEEAGRGPGHRPQFGRHLLGQGAAQPDPHLRALPGPIRLNNFNPPAGSETRELDRRIGHDGPSAWQIRYNLREGERLAEPGRRGETPRLLARLTKTEEQMVTQEKIEEALGKVIDPHVGMSVVDMGMIRDIAVEGNEVEVKMVLTAPGCPLASYLVEQVRKAAEGVAGVEKAKVTLLDEPWSPAFMKR